MATRRLGISTLLLSLLCIYCAFVAQEVSCAARILPELSKIDGVIHEISPAGDVIDSADVIMKEDAEEVFYNVNLDKYDDAGVRCPEPVAPSNGYIRGSEDLRVGAVLYVTCLHGYRLQGPTVMACQPVGEEGAQWDPDTTRECVEGSEDFNETQQDVSSEDEERQSEFSRFQRRRHMSKTQGEPTYLDMIQRSWLPTHKYSVLPLAGHLPETIQDGADIYSHNNNNNDDDDNGNFLSEQMANVAESSRMSEPLAKTPGYCKEQADTGPCKAYFRRFYFNPHTAECEQFVYGGCLGNKNNFESLKECNKKCLDNE